MLVELFLRLRFKIPFSSPSFTCESRSWLSILQHVRNFVNVPTWSSMFEEVHCFRIKRMIIQMQLRINEARVKICVNLKVFRWVSAFTLRLVPSQRDFAFGVDEKELIFQRSKMAWACTAICSLKRFLELHLSIIQYVMKRKTEEQACEDLKERALISHTKLIQLIDWNRSQYLSNSKFW